MTLAQEDSLIDWGWIDRNLGAIWGRIVEHLFLTSVSVIAGLILAVGLAVLVIRNRKAYGPITAVAGILYTIPSLAMFALLVPLVGIGALSAIIALTSYTLLILVRNIVAGLDGVPSAVIEAADGMGYTRRQRFWSMELPLALPVIVAGLRIASVTTVGLVTVSSLLGLGGSGFYILRGLQTFNWTQILVGVGLSVILATVIDLVFVLLLRAVSPWTRVRTS